MAYTEAVRRIRTQQRKVRKLKESLEASGDQKKLTKIVIFLMVSLAIVFDLINFLINFIPIIGQIISIFVSIVGYSIFIIWFMLKGIKLTTKKRAASMGIGCIIELLPLVNMLPAMTASVVLTILTTITKKS